MGEMASTPRSTSLLELVLIAILLLDVYLLGRFVNQVLLFALREALVRIRRVRNGLICDSIRDWV
jgi:hypothetical protein